MLQVINLTPEQVAMMPPDQQKTINELVSGSLAWLCGTS